MLKISEHDLQSALMDWVRIYEAQYPELSLLYAVPNGMRTFRGAAVKAQREGMKAGVPDLCLPVARYKYHGLYIELKVGRNTTSPAQDAYIALLQEQGYLVKICRDMESATGTLLHYLGQRPWVYISKDGSSTQAIQVVIQLRDALRDTWGRHPLTCNQIKDISHALHAAEAIIHLIGQENNAEAETRSQEEGAGDG